MAVHFLLEWMGRLLTIDMSVSDDSITTAVLSDGSLLPSAPDAGGVIERDLPNRPRSWWARDVDLKNTPLYSTVGEQAIRFVKKNYRV